MLDIGNLCILTINCETIGKQAASDENKDNSKRNCQCKTVIQIEGGKFESYENKRQDAEAQRQHNADNTAESIIVTYPIVISNNSNENSFSSQKINKDSNTFLSEVTINEIQSFVSDQLRKDNTVTGDTKQTNEIHTNAMKALFQITIKI